MESYVLDENGPLIASEADGANLIGEAFGRNVERVVIPAARLAPEFFRLGSGLAGAILQKFSNYRLRLAIVGDISTYTAKSAPLRDFIAESNRRGEVVFVGRLDDLAQ